MALRFSCGENNAFSTEVIRSLAVAIEEAAGNARGVMLAGGDRFFSNGLDLEWVLGCSPQEMRTLFLELGACVLHLLESPLPIVGVAKGHAIGGALALLLACDYRYAARGHVLLGKPEILLGVPNPYYGDQLLRLAAGDAVASDLIYSGRLVPGEEARALHLVHDVAEKAELEDVAWRQLVRLCELAPAAFVESKRMRSERLCSRLREQMSARVARQVEIWGSDDAQARLRAASKRLAQR